MTGRTLTLSWLTKEICCLFYCYLRKKFAASFCPPFSICPISSFLYPQFLSFFLCITKRVREKATAVAVAGIWQKRLPSSTEAAASTCKYFKRREKNEERQDGGKKEEEEKQFSLFLPPFSTTADSEQTNSFSRLRSCFFGRVSVSLLCFFWSCFNRLLPWQPVYVQKRWVCQWAGVKRGDAGDFLRSTGILEKHRWRWDRLGGKFEFSQSEDSSPFGFPSSPSSDWWNCLTLANNYIHATEV